MKVKLAKDFMDHKKGDVVEVDSARANYWKLVGVADVHKETTQTASKAAPKAASKSSKK